MTRVFLLLPAAVACFVATGCHEIKPVPPPAPAPQSGAQLTPIIKSFSVDPASIRGGASASLSWSVTDSESVRLDHGIGEVEPKGRRTVTPSGTTTYKLTATNLHGTADAAATVTVGSPPTGGASGSAGNTDKSVAIVSRQLRDLHFDYNEDVIRRNEQAVLSEDTSLLKSLLQSDPSIAITIEGHSDERGSPEYNMGLADRRANYVRDALIRSGLPGDRLTVVSYGDQRPECSEATEECYLRNRRAHFRLEGQ